MPRWPSTDISDEDRFMRYTEPEPMSGCWVWIGARKANEENTLWEQRPYGVNRRRCRICNRDRLARARATSVIRAITGESGG